MATIQLTMPHKLSDPVAHQRAEIIAKQFASKFEGLTHRWIDPATLTFEGTSGTAKGVKGALRVGPASVTLTIELPMLLGLIRGQIEEAAREQMNKHLR